ncbi:MAG: polymer-forming cytoskeletal protein [Alphaproteobacteria bacterium]|nr:polymer-forming cytoskeletal protein [Alphaproteobacteria bacterium]
MFGRNQDQRPPDQPAPAAPARPVPPIPAPVAPPSAAGESVIGEDLAIVGERITVISQSRVKINGTIQGDINGKEVIVGPRGRVLGTVTANHIQIEGQVHGALRGASITLMPSARVDGDIFHQKLAISEGAQFDGRVRRPQDASEITPNLDAESLKGTGSTS